MKSTDMKMGWQFGKVVVIFLLYFTYGTLLYAQSNIQPRIDTITDENILEDAGLQVINLTGITDGDGGTQILTITAVSSNTSIIADSDIVINYTNPQATGTLSYTPSLDANGAVLITVTVKDDGGTAGGGIDTFVTSFIVTVNPVNDAPTFTKGTDIPVIPDVVLEDAGLQNIINWATNINTGGTLGNELFQNLTFNLQIISTTGTLTFDNLSVNSSGTLSFSPAANTNGVATIKIELQDDGSGTPPDENISQPDTMKITVTSVNDAPVFTVGPDIDISEDSGPQLFTAWASAISPGGGADEASQNLSFNIVQTSENMITFITFPVVDPVSGDITFEVAPDVSGTATLEITLVDDGASVIPNQNTSTKVTFFINVNPINDAPSFTIPGNYNTFEDFGEVSIANFATSILAGPPDEITQDLTFVVDVVQTTGGLAFVTPPAINDAGTLSFETLQDTFGSADINVTLTDDGPSGPPHVNSSPIQTFTIIIDSVNDPPVFVKGTDPVVNEDSGPVVITGWAQNITPGPDNETGQSVTFLFNSIGTEGALTFISGPEINATGDLSFEASPDTNGRASFEISLTDDGPSGGLNQNTSQKQLLTINVDPVNDPPVFTAGPDQVVDENAGLVTITGWATGISPGGGTDEQDQSVIFTIEAVSFTDNLVFSIGPFVSPEGDLSFQTVPNTFGEADFAFYLSDDGLSESPDVNRSANQAFKITVNEINDTPSEILLSNRSVLESAAAGTTVGTLTALDPDDNTHTFSLVAGTGSEGNTAFTISGNDLITNTTFDIDEQNLYSIRISASDGLNTIENVFLIDILNDPVSSVTFPSAFTPNNDGENDTWIIEDIEYFPTALINIYNRNGQQVFRSIGYATAWDGTWNGKALPEDTYYVVINLKNDKPVIQGTITILR